MRDSQSSHQVHTTYAHNLIRMKARQLVRRPEFRRYGQREIEQDLWVHLLSQSERFDPERGSINAFVYTVVNSGVGMLIRRRKRKMRAPDCDIQSLDVTTLDSEEQPVPLGETMSVEDVERRTGGTSRPDAELSDDADAFEHARQSLSPAQRRICDHLAEGTLTSAARALGVSRRKLRASVADIRAQFERAGFGEI